MQNLSAQRMRAAAPGVKAGEALRHPGSAVASRGGRVRALVAAVAAAVVAAAAVADPAEPQSGGRDQFPP